MNGCQVAGYVVPVTWICAAAVVAVVAFICATVWAVQR